ncbi:DUF6266 family protein [Sphingobacterium tabacisoli]|uniref:DUF6266 family protein n=1 Tax=Sphingobacterium tabacisoli TaxID=2044855 RepID=A0ABW5L4A7_9SPHI|nr:DUF6266 family protein [Sphingobacterium tabacisoli]
MARFLKGITGAYTGKVGNVVGSSWRGIDYIRSLPKKSSKPASEDQIIQRTRFRMATNFLKSIKDILKIGFSDSKQRGRLGYNVAFQHFIGNAIQGTYPALTVDYSVVRIASGSLAPLMGLTMEESAPQQLTINWESQVNRFNAFADDEVVVLLYNVDENFFSVYEGLTRADATLEITLPASYVSKTIVGWSFNIHRDGVATSSSQYLGEIEVS